MVNYFDRYLYGELHSLYVHGSSSSIFQLGSDGKCLLHLGVNFHLFTSHVPCMSVGCSAVLVNLF